MASSWVWFVSSFSCCVVDDPAGRVRDSANIGIGFGESADSVLSVGYWREWMAGMSRAYLCPYWSCLQYCPEDYW